MTTCTTWWIGSARARLSSFAGLSPPIPNSPRPPGQNAARRHMSITGIWESGRGDLAERHDEIIRGRLQRPA
jgi:hypothetical protein